MLFVKDRASVIPIFSFHKGCKSRCSFCNQESMVDSSSIDPGSIKRHIDHYISTLRHKEAVETAFFGGTFTQLTRSDMFRYLEPVQQYIKNGAISGIRISTRPDAVSDDILSFLKEYNVRTICLGIESIDPEVLEKSNRGYSLDTVEEAVAKINEKGIKVVLQIMLGLPCDTAEKSRRTILWASEKPIAGVRVCPTLILKNTQLESLYKKNEYRLWDKSVFYELLELALILFYQRNIPVIRIGLCIDKSIRENYIAGLMHHSLGDYVEYRAFFRILKYLLNIKNINDRLDLESSLKRFLNGYNLENRKRILSETRIKDICYNSGGISENDILSSIQSADIDILFQ